MIAIIIFWTLLLVSLKLLALIVMDAFRPLPKPTGERESRESAFLCPTKAALTAMKNGRGIEDLPTWPAPPPPPPPVAPDRVILKIDSWGLDLKAASRLVGLRKWQMARHDFADPNYRGLGKKSVSAKLALAKSLDIPLKRVLNEDLWRHPDYLRWRGLNLNLVLGSRSTKFFNVNFGWVKNSALYDCGDRSPIPDYYIWMLPNHDFTEWEVMGVISYAEAARCVSRMRRSNSRAIKRGSSYRRPDCLEGKLSVGIRKCDIHGERSWMHPLDWYRKEALSNG